MFASLTISLGAYSIFTLLACYLGAENWPDTMFNERRAVAALLVMVCTEIVDFLRQNYVAKTASGLLSSAEDRKAIEAFDKWFKSLFSRRWQWTFLTIALAAASPLICSFTHHASRHDRIQTIVAGYVVAFFGLHGLYFALFIPQLARLVSRQNMHLYWLRPADTPWIERLSAMFTAMCIGQIFGGSVAFPILWLRMPKGSTVGFLASLIWLVIACVVVCYSFLFPQYFLARVIKEKKQKDVALLQSELHYHLQTCDSFGHAQEWSSSMQNVFGAYELAATAPETAVNFKSSIFVVGSLLFPAINLVLQLVPVLSPKK
ncbi:MAG: hypothetical protein ABI833_00235 [Acidobacteriota bacterium]